MNAAANTSEYSTLNRALKSYRENFMNGSLSGCETHEELVEMLRAIEKRMFEIVANS